MESISINTIKGYSTSRVEDLAYYYFRGGRHKTTQTQSKKRSLIFIAVVSAMVLGTVIIGTVAAGTLIINNTTTNNKSISTADSILEAVCNVTHYPKSCVSSLQQQLVMVSSSSSSSSGSSRDAAAAAGILKLSISVALKELSNLSSIIPATSAANNKKRGVEAALRDCQGMIEDAVDKLETSITSMEEEEEKRQQLQLNKVNDIRTWLSAALTDLDTCLDSLEDYMDGHHDSSILLLLLPEHLKTAMHNSKEYTSNTLSLLSNLPFIPALLHHRKLLAPL